VTGSPRHAPIVVSLWALLGAALLAVCAHGFRLDQVLCAAWPPRAIGFGYGVVYLAAIFALAWAWRRVADGRWVLAVHTIALTAMPFLSSDPLMYAAIGRALAGGASSSTPLSVALGGGHPFLAALPPAWRDGTSAYGPAWNLLGEEIGRLSGGHLGAALLLHKLVAMLAVLFGAWIVARATTRTAFALITLCPLSIVEATVGAHNDALLVPLAALALAAWLRGRAAAALVWLALGLLIKASAAIVLLPAALAMLLARTPARARAPLLAALVLMALATLGVLPLLRDGPLDAVSRLVERPDVPYDHCTRSLECLPRVLFRFVLHMPTAAWATGLLFRALGILWLGWIALRAAQCAEHGDRIEPVRWLARGLFVYFLLLHGWAQSWYLLPLLVALPLFEDDPIWGPGLRIYTVSAVAYYALVLPMSCLQDPLTIAVSDLLEAAITILPPVVLLLRQRKAHP
jgi:hypothetical protein